MWLRKVKVRTEITFKGQFCNTIISNFVFLQIIISELWVLIVNRSTSKQVMTLFKQITNYWLIK